MNLIFIFYPHKSTIFAAELVMNLKHQRKTLAPPKQCLERITFLLEMALFFYSITKTGDFSSASNVHLCALRVP